MAELSRFEVVGTIVDVDRRTVGQRGTLLVEVSIEQCWEDWQGAESVNPLVAKILGKRADSMFNPGPEIGDKVRIDGFIEGRAWKDRVYLDLQIDTITVLEQAVPVGEAQEPASEMSPEDEVPF